MRQLAGGGSPCCTGVTLTRKSPTAPVFCVPTMKRIQPTNVATNNYSKMLLKWCPKVVNDIYLYLMFIYIFNPIDLRKRHLSDIYWMVRW